MTGDPVNAMYGAAFRRAPVPSFSRAPLYSFGYGLSYTTFSIAPPTLDKPGIAVGGRIAVGTVVTNTGARGGDEVVQLYIQQRAGRAARPIRLLQGFQRVTLSPGQSREVHFTLDESNVRYWNPVERAWVIDPGMFDAWVGNSSAASPHIKFTVAGAPRIVL